MRAAKAGVSLQADVEGIEGKCSVMLHAVAGSFLRDVGGHDNRRACA